MKGKQSLLAINTEAEIFLRKYEVEAATCEENNPSQSHKEKLA